MAEMVTPRQRKAIEALLTCGNVTQAAEAAGVTRNTLYRWFKQEPFKVALAAAEGEAMQALSRTLVRLGDKAGAVLEGVLTDKEAGDPVRLRAVAILLQNLVKLREAGALEERIAALEAKQ